MTFGLLGDLNWLAVIVAAIAYFAVGGAWFASPVFGRVWSEAMGWERTEDEPSPGPEMYIGPLATCLIATIGTAMVAEASATDTFAEGIVLGLVVGVLLAGAVLFVTGYFDPKKPKPMAWFLVTAGYHLVGLLVASIILSLWT